MQNKSLSSETVEIFVHVAERAAQITITQFPEKCQIIINKIKIAIIIKLIIASRYSDFDLPLLFINDRVITDYPMIVGETSFLFLQFSVTEIAVNAEKSRPSVYLRPVPPPPSDAGKITSQFQVPPLLSRLASLISLGNPPITPWSSVLPRPRTESTSRETRRAV